MNARQRRMQRRLVAPAVHSLIAGVEAAAECMETTGQTMTPAECRAMADGLREMLARSPSWKTTATRATRRIAL